MATRKEITKKLKSLGQNRRATDEDVKNVEKHGMELLDRTFGGNQGVPTNETVNKTPAQSGQDSVNQAETIQETGDTGLSTIEYGADLTAEESLEQLTEQGAIVSQIVEEGLRAKAKAQPIAENIAKERRKLGQISLSDYKGIPMDKALQLMNNDIAEINSRIGYYQGKADEDAQVRNQIISDTTELLNSQLASIGLKVQNEREARDFAFSPAVLMSGQMPPGLSPEMQQSWAAASNEAKRQQAVAEYNSRPRGGESKRSTTLTEINGRPVLIDTQTGEIIQDYSEGTGDTTYTPMSFEDYISGKEQEMGMSLSAEAREAMRGEYNQTIESGQTDFTEQQVSRLSPLSQSVYYNPAGYADLTPTEKGNVQAELQSIGLSPALLGANREDSLRKEHTTNPTVKVYLDSRDAFQKIQTVATGEPSAAGDMSLIFNYMKILDPGSTVREGEQATAREAAGIPDRIRAAYNNAVDGQSLSEGQRADFLNQAQAQFSSIQAEKEAIDNYYRQIAEQQGLNPENIITQEAGRSAGISDLNFSF